MGFGCAGQAGLMPATRRPENPIQKFRSHRFHAETHISTQPPQPLQDARLSQPHENQERGRGPVTAARQGPQACFRKRGVSRLRFRWFFPFSKAAIRCLSPKVRRNGDMPEARFDWRSTRLRKHADYQRVYRESRRHSSASMTYFFRAREAGEPAGVAPRIGLTTGRVLGGAVERNRIRRRMREAVRMHVVELPQRMDVVLHPRKQVLEMEFARLENEVSRIFAAVAAAGAKA
jgi:ribonuclease P protein component